MPTTTRLALTDDAERARIQERTLTVVVASQVLGGAGLAAGVTVGALLAQEMPDGPQRAQLITEFQTQLDVHATQR